MKNTHATAIPGRYVHVEIPIRNGNYPCLVMIRKISRTKTVYHKLISQHFPSSEKSLFWRFLCNKNIHDTIIKDIENISITSNEISSAFLGPTRILNNTREVIAFKGAGDSTLLVSSVCPHFGGPLSRTTNSVNELVCELHGWVFDLPSGKCTNRQSNCSLTFYVPLIISNEEGNE
jgi:nitrite reductase/ring-hydroxylating ferredoxin subunit